MTLISEQMCQMWLIEEANLPLALGDEILMANQTDFSTIKASEKQICF